jgi:hypothetical protein
MRTGSRTGLCAHEKIRPPAGGDVSGDNSAIGGCLWEVSFRLSAFSRQLMNLIPEVKNQAEWSAFTFFAES